MANRKRNPGFARTKSCPAGRTISALRADDICEPELTDDEAPKPFRFRGFIYPGSYLLSRDLSSNYHRRADVSLPGSEWDRVGPSGYDHQASALLRTFHFVLRTSACLAVICACGLLLCVLAAGVAGSRLTSAWLRVLRFLCFALTSLLSVIRQKLLVTGVVYKVCWMLVVLGSIHYCNYTCTLSTWSSSTLL